MTGASSGIGKELAKELYQKEGCKLVLLDKNIKELKTLKEQELPLAYIFEGDVNRQESLKEFLRFLSKEGVDILINCAGSFYSGQFENMNFDHFKKIIDVDLIGMARITHALLPKLLESDRGTLVNISSLAGLISAPGMVAYCGAKFGVTGFSTALGLELEGKLDVCTVFPSLVRTEIAQNALYGTEKVKSRKRLDKFVTQLGRNPEKVASLIVKGIKKRKKMIIINLDAYFFYYVHKFLPQLAENTIRRLYCFLLKKGVVFS